MKNKRVWQFESKRTTYYVTEYAKINGVMCYIVKSWDKAKPYRLIRFGNENQVDGLLAPCGKHVFSSKLREEENGDR